jgi:VWFA-related protein
VTERSAKESAEPEKHLIAAAQSGADASGVALSMRDREVAKVTLAALQESQRIVQDQHTQPALAGLIALARTQRQIEGRKIVIFFSQSLHADINTQDVLLSIIGSANRAGLSIYSVDTNAVNAEAGQGLIATVVLGNMASAQAQAPPSPLFNTATLTPIPNPAPAGLGTQVNDRFNRSMNEGLAGHTEPLAFLAESTGGTYMTANDNLRKPLERLLEDTTTYYELSYVPPIQEYDGRFRTVSIQPVHEKLRIQSRAGYFALPPGSNGGSIRPFEAPMLAALALPEMPANLNFRSSVLRLGELPDGNANELVVEVPLSEVAMKEDVNTKLFSLHVAIVSQIKNKAGTVIEHFSEDIPRHGASETMSDTRSQVITMQRHFIAPPGEYVLETAVMDRTNGKLAAQRSDFTIAPKPDGAYLSDLALVRRTDPFTWEADPLEPLRYQNGKVVPNLSGALAPESKEVSFFLMIHPDPAALEAARLEMEVSRNGEVLARMPLPLRATSGQGAVPYLASIQSKSLPAGNYQVSTILTQAGNTMARTISLQVGGPILASTAIPNAAPVPNADNKDIEQPDSDIQTSALKPLNSHPIVITSLPTTAMTAPSPERLATLISNTRERALGYAKSLPNFVCVEVTDRSVDPSGQGKWKRQDTMAELLRFRDHNETRTTLEVNGHRATTERDDMNGTLNRGEFGALLDTLFKESAKADFQWKETALLGSENVEVLNYHVEKENSTFTINVGKDHITPGFHGLVYIDSASNGIRRVTMEADPMPAVLSVKAAAFTVDYDYIAIGTHDYLMPVRASMSLRHGKKSVINDMVFRDYRRYGAKSKVLGSGDPVKH